MKVAITAQGTTLAAPMDPRLGRAKYFLVADTESGACESLANDVNLNAAQGAGIQAGQRVVKSGARAVITGHVGPKAFSVLQAGGVQVFLASDGTAGEALARFRDGKLSQRKSADVDGHWG